MINYGRTKPPLGAQPDPAWVQRTGLVGMWLFNERGGNKAYDLSGNNNTGTLTNMAFPPTAISGWNGQGLSFDGGDDYVNAGSMNSIKGISQLTISGWMKKNAVTDLYGALFFQSETGQALEFLFHGGVLYLSANSGGYLATNITPYYTTTWTHWVMVFDGTQTGNANRVKLYVNGAYVNMGSGTGTIGNVTASSTIMASIGRDQRNNYTFNGQIDDVRIYNRALSAGEVAQQYAEPYYMIPKPRVYNFLGSPIRVQKDVVMPLESLSEIIKDSDIPLEVIGQINKDGILSYENLPEIQGEQKTFPIELLGQVVSEGVFPYDYQLSIESTYIVLVEYLKEVVGYEVEFDIEILQQVIADHGVSLEYLVEVVSDGVFPIEFTGIFEPIKVIEITAEAYYGIGINTSQIYKITVSAKPR